MITTAGGWVGSWIQSRRTRAQNRADDATASEKFASAAKTLIEPLRQEVVALRIGSKAQQATIDKQQRTINRLEATQKANIAHIEKLDRKIVYLTHGVGVLTRQITRAGLQPEWVYSDNEDGSSGRIVVDDAGDPDRSGSDGDA
ncbi:MAG TPA: hypothetical protein PL117_03325 [Accumulibacter sp.]|uniref:hypothetical protein n=1 Tax=Accumulibacter sp. TaxID=2053492 RepID=UPI002BB223E3|nr:hypothetical protein [Accumulibacter sp.]HRF71779.1 hypothetical protein [Accumulibacter sp.]